MGGVPDHSLDVGIQVHAGETRSSWKVSGYHGTPKAEDKYRPLTDGVVRRLLNCDFVQIPSTFVGLGAVFIFGSVGPREKPSFPII